MLPILHHAGDTAPWGDALMDLSEPTDLNWNGAIQEDLLFGIMGNE